MVSASTVANQATSRRSAEDCAQNVRNVDATMIPRLAPEDLQFLAESLRATATPSVPTTPPLESEDEKTPGDEGF